MYADLLALTKDQPYRDSLRRDHWPDTRVGSYKDYALDWSRFLINGGGERFAVITHVQWFLPKAIQGNKINVQGDITVVWLKPVIEGTYPVLCKIQDSAARIHYKAMYLTIGGRIDGGAGGECRIKSEATHKEPE